MGRRSLGGSRAICMGQVDDVPNQSQQRTHISLISMGMDAPSEGVRGNVYILEHDI